MSIQPLPSAPPPSSTSSGMLTLGSRGPDVLRLQQALAKLGFNPSGFDGWLGPKTAAAVRAFQRAAGIVVDGKVGPQTWGAIAKRLAASAAPKPPTSSAMLKQGSRGPDVLRLQKALLQLGFNPSGLDGSFGPKTAAAVVAFQRAAGIVVDGKVGPQTWGAIARRLLGGGAAPTGGTGGTGGVPAPGGGIPKMLAWARSMIGTPYAAVNPFRFGDVLWDGKAHRSVNGSGTVWQYPRGTRVFDCSGFVVAAFRQLGVDLAARGLATSWAFNADTRFLKPVTHAQLAPGDLIVYEPKNGVGHVVIYLGNGQTIESRGGAGVVVGQVDWARVRSYRRVPLP